MEDGFRDNEYLGDGAYASFDGYQIWLAANHHDNRVIALEPAVMDALIRYWTSLKRKYAPERSAAEGAGE